MDFKIKEARRAYNITQKEMSDITQIPKRTIENWETGKRVPSKWVETMVLSYLKQFPSNAQGIITEHKGVYEIKQIKNTVLSIICQYDVDKVILFGSYAKGTPSPLSDIDIAIDGAVKGFDFFALLEDMNQAFVKDIDLIHLTEVDEDSKVMKAIQEGMVLYEREG